MNPECQHVREVMDSYLAEELSVESNHDVLRHLGKCHECAQELKNRQRLRALLSEATDIAVEAELAGARVAQALDREQRSWRRVAGFAGIAAALIVAVAFAYWTSAPVDVAAYDDLAADHVACTSYYSPGATYDAARATRNLAAPFTSIVDSIGLWHGPYQVIDAHMCPYKGRNYAHVVLRGGGQTLSLFAERPERGALPEASTSPLPGDTIDVHATARLGYRISAVETHDYRIFFVSERPTDPPAIEHDILRSALRYVRTLDN